MTEQEKDIFDALEIFIKKFRKFLVDEIQKVDQVDWYERFRHYLTDTRQGDRGQQLKNWDKTVQKHQGKIDPVDLIDYHHLKTVAITAQSLFAKHFLTYLYNLPTWFDEIAIVRHNIAHFTFFHLHPNDIEKAWIHMKMIATCLKDDDLLDDLERIKRRHIQRALDTQSNININEQVKHFQHLAYQDTKRKLKANPYEALGLPSKEIDKILLEDQIKLIKKTLKIYSHESLFNRCGFLLLSLAKLQGNKKLALDEAEGMFTDAISLDPQSYESYNNWGNVLYEKAIMNNEKEVYYVDAIAKYDFAKSLNPYYLPAYYNCGNVYQKLAARKNGEDRQKFLTNALHEYLNAEGLFQSEEHFKDYQSYNISCIYAQLNDMENSIHYLDRAIQTGKYKHINIQKDTDFDFIKKSPEFINLLSSM